MKKYKSNVCTEPERLREPDKVKIASLRSDFFLKTARFSDLKASGPTLELRFATQRR